MTDIIQGSPKDPRLGVFWLWAEENESIFQEDLLHRDLALDMGRARMIIEGEKIEAATNGYVKLISATLLRFEPNGMAVLKISALYNDDGNGRIYGISSEFGVLPGDTIPLCLIFISEDPVLASEVDKGTILFKVKSLNAEFGAATIGPVFEVEQEL